MMRGFVFAAFAVVCMGVCVCWAAAPEPAVVPGAGLWTIDTGFTHPRQIVLRTGIENKPRRFWYSLVTTTNKTNHKVDFYPKCELMTDTFQILPAGKNVTPAVFQNVKSRYETTYPFLEPFETVRNELLRGEDNAKDIAVIWPDFDSKAKKIKIFITGLSNETAAVDHPVAKDKDGAPVKVYLRKTLELTYILQADSALRSDANLIYKSKRWIMR